ncbi:putative monovalent cation/H+ antiporter subunit A [soil metagenome]
MLIVASLAGFVAAVLAPMLWRLSQRLTDWLVPAVPFCLTIYFASLINRVTGGETVTGQLNWIPALNISLAFSVDGLSLLFALLITSIGTLVMLYSTSYLAGREDRGRFHALILLFMSSMLGLVLADNLVALIIFWELTTVSSFFLIGFEHHEADARSSAWTALIVTGIGGQALLAGLVLLGIVSGNWSISDIVASGDTITDHDLYLPILLLVSLGAFTKSAQVPFHFWLPAAMAAPTPVSAYLHSATMVKAGIYVLARLHPALGGTNAWLYLLTIVGSSTMVIAAYLALQQTDLKRILAYATISALGAMVMLLGLGTHLAIAAVMTMLVAHSLYKGTLFLVTGSIDHATGTRNVNRLGGLRQAMPLTTAAGALAAASLAGLPLFAGFISKELLYDAALRGTIAGSTLTAITVVAKALLVTIAGIIFIRAFLGDTPEHGDKAHEAPIRMWLGPLLLGVAGLAIGIAPGVMIGPIIEQSAGNIIGAPVSADLKLWHGLNLIFALSAATIAGGIVIYLLREPIGNLSARLEPLGEWGPARIYDRGLDALNWVAITQTRFLQSGYLRYHLLTIVAVTVLLVGGAAALRDGIGTPASPLDVRFHELVVAFSIVAGAGIAIYTRSRLGAVIALGVIGYGIALIYLLFGTIDLAIVQILIETLIIIMFILMFYHLPRFAILSSPATRLRDGLIAVASGILVTTLVLTANSVQLAPAISEYYVDEIRLDEHRQNVVDAIITDFRNLDTLGEAVVFGLAGIGVLALLRLRLEGPEAPGRSVIGDRRIESLIFNRAVQFLMPLMLLYSIFLFLRGPTAPGRGFAGGIVGASALILYAIARGIDPARRATRLSSRFLIGIGLLFIIVAGLLPGVFGEPFLTVQVWRTLDVAGLGVIKFGSSLLFETGIYLLVFGVALLIIFTIGEE